MYIYISSFSSRTMVVVTLPTMYRTTLQIISWKVIKLAKEHKHTDILVYNFFLVYLPKLYWHSTFCLHYRINWLTVCFFAVWLSILENCLNKYFICLGVEKKWNNNNIVSSSAPLEAIFSIGKGKKIFLAGFR